MTLEGMGLYEALSQENTVCWHWHAPGQATLDQAAQAQVYLTSANALAETGELINIDGTGNRVSAALGAHEVVCYVVGQNKVAPTLDQALWRARNIAAPLNARRLKRETPCAQGELKCHDLQKPPADLQRALPPLAPHGRGGGDDGGPGGGGPGLLSPSQRNRMPTGRARLDFFQPGPSS